MLKKNLILVLLIGFLCNCSGNHRVSSIPYVLLLNPTEGFVPKKMQEVHFELDHMLPKSMKEAIRIAYSKASKKKNVNNIDFFEIYIDKLFSEMAKFSPTEDGTYLAFRNDIVGYWNLNKEGNFTRSYMNIGLDAQSIVNIIIQSYGAYLNNSSIDLQLLTKLECKKETEYINENY